MAPAAKRNLGKAPIVDDSDESDCVSYSLLLMFFYEILCYMNLVCSLLISISKYMNYRMESFLVVNLMILYMKFLERR